jgi:hypothetical protein
MSEPAEVVIERGGAGMVRAEHVTMERAGAGAVAAGGDVTITNGAVGATAAGGNVRLSNLISGPILAGGDVEIERTLLQTGIAIGGLRVGRGGFVGAVLSPKTTIEDGGKVLLDLKGAIALGAAAGFVAGLLRRRR